MPGSENGNTRRRANALSLTPPSMPVQRAPCNRIAAAFLGRAPIRASVKLAIANSMNAARDLPLRPALPIRVWLVDLVEPNGRQAPAGRVPSPRERVRTPNECGRERLDNKPQHLSAEPRDPVTIGTSRPASASSRGSRRSSAAAPPVIGLCAGRRAGGHHETARLNARRAMWRGSELSVWGVHALNPLRPWGSTRYGR